MIHLLLFLILSTNQLRATDYTEADIGGRMDVAEAALRVVLNSPAHGLKFPKEMTSCEAKLESSLILLNISHQFPGLLKSNQFPDWEQFQTVKKLFRELEVKHKFYYRDLERRKKDSH